MTIFKWSLFKITSVALIALWAFNPLGSQASLRAVDLKEVIGDGIGRITYYNHNVSTQLALTMMVPGSTSRPMPTVRALFSAALYDSVVRTQYSDNTSPAYENIVLSLGGHEAAGVQAATDPWGNLRVPNLKYFPGYDSKRSDRWLDVPWKESIQNYSSLVGDRIDGVHQNFTGNTTFNITSSFQNFGVSSNTCPGLLKS